MGPIFTAILNSALQMAYKALSDYMEKRGLIQQGREAQRRDDLESTVKEARDAAAIREAVQASPDSVLDAELNSLRHPNSTAR